MQTFLPYPDFSKTAAYLDRQRLGNQRCEAKVILKTALGVTQGWAHHPAVRMWQGSEIVLCDYGIAIYLEWRHRGYKDKQLEFFKRWRTMLFRLWTKDSLWPSPVWLGNEDFHVSHRSNLLRKNPEHYSQFGWEEPADLPYYWPVPKETL